MYKSLDKFDVVNGIFKEKILSDSCQQLKNGWQSETAGDWERAYETYETEVNKMPENFTLTSQDQKFTLEAYYKVCCCCFLNNFLRIFHEKCKNFTVCCLSIKMG